MLILDLFLEIAPKLPEHTPADLKYGKLIVSQDSPSPQEEKSAKDLNKPRPKQKWRISPDLSRSGEGHTRIHPR